MEEEPIIANTLIEVGNILNLTTETLDQAQGFNHTIIINNITAAVEMSVQTVSNVEYIEDAISVLYVSAYNLVWSLTLWNYF